MNYVGNVYLFKNNKATDCEMRGDHFGVVTAESQINGKYLLQVVYLSSTTAERNEICVEVENISNNKGIEKTVAICNQNFSISSTRIASKVICVMNREDLEKVRKTATDYINGKFDKKGNRIPPADSDKSEDTPICTDEERHGEDYTVLFAKERKIDSYLSKLSYLRNNINNLDLAIEKIRGNKIDVIDKSIENCLYDNQLDQHLNGMIADLESNIKVLEDAITSTMNMYDKPNPSVVEKPISVSSEKIISISKEIEAERQKDEKRNIFVTGYLQEYIIPLHSQSEFSDDLHSDLTKADATKERILYLIENGITSTADLAKVFNTSTSSIYRVKSGRKR